MCERCLPSARCQHSCLMSANKIQRIIRFHTIPESKNSASEGDTMKVRPLQDRLLVRRVEEQEKTKGGIIIPDSAKERPLEGEVIAIGSGKRLEDGTL